MKRELIELLLVNALKARLQAYAPYSQYMVGAAILTQNGNIYSGCNVECVDHDGTHAEETALSAMVMHEERIPIAVLAIGAKEEVGDPSIITPCGKCRQKLYEFVSLNSLEIDVVVSFTKGKYVVKRLTAMLTDAFGPRDVGIDLARYRSR